MCVEHWKIGISNTCNHFFINQIKASQLIIITNPKMTRFFINFNEALELVRFAFNHVNPSDLFTQKVDASTIGDFAKEYKYYLVIRSIHHYYSRW